LSENFLSKNTKHEAVGAELIDRPANDPPTVSK